MFFCYLIVLDGLGQRLHLHSLIQLVFMQQVDEMVQRALVEAHFRMQCAHTLEDIHTTGIQSPTGKKDTFCYRFRLTVSQKQIWIPNPAAMAFKNIVLLKASVSNTKRLVFVLQN